MAKIYMESGNSHAVAKQHLHDGFIKAGVATLGICEDAMILKIHTSLVADKFGLEFLRLPILPELLGKTLTISVTKGLLNLRSRERIATEYLRAIVKQYDASATIGFGGSVHIDKDAIKKLKNFVDEKVRQSQILGE